MNKLFYFFNKLISKLLCEQKKRKLKSFLFTRIYKNVKNLSQEFHNQPDVYSCKFQNTAFFQLPQNGILITI